MSQDDADRLAQSFMCYFGFTDMPEPDANGYVDADAFYEWLAENKSAMERVRRESPLMYERMRSLPIDR